MQTEMSTQIWIKLEALLIKTSEKQNKTKKTQKRVPKIANMWVLGSITYLKTNFFLNENTKYLEYPKTI